jgi:hypothetical protein
MLKLARPLGFIEKENAKEGFVEIVLSLNPAEHPWQSKRLYVFE